MAAPALQPPVPSEHTPLLQDRDGENSVQYNDSEAADSENPAKTYDFDESHPFLIDVSKARFWLIYSPILLQYFVAMFDTTLMASSHPVITSYFNASNAASWLSTSFMVTSTSFQPIYGRVSDTIGRRPVYLFALAVFTGATAWCACARSIGGLIAARAACGLGAGGMIAMGGIITNDLVKIEVRGTYQAYINLFYGGGSAFGAAFGGFLCDLLGWRWAFGVQIPLAVIIIVSAYFTTPTELGPQLAKHAEKSAWQMIRDFDFVGAFLVLISSSMLILGLNLGGNVLPWTHPLVISSLVLFAVTAALFLLAESRAIRPVIPLDILFTAPRAYLVLANFTAMIGVNTVLFNAPLYFQAVKGDSPTISGFRLAIPSALLTICGVSCGFWLSHTGRMKSPQVVGGICMLLGASCLSSMWDTIPTWLATLYVSPSSIGQGLMFPATTIAVLATTIVEDQAVMTSTLMLWRNFGTVVGVALSSLILQNALLVYLNQFVIGGDKHEIIERVRKSVSAIHDLTGNRKHQAITAYLAALRVTFLSAVLAFAITTILILPVRLPRLRRDRVAADVDNE